MGTVHCLEDVDTVHPDAILEMAKHNLDEVVVVGTDKDGNLWVSASGRQLDRIYWLLHLAASKCINTSPFDTKSY